MKLNPLIIEYKMYRIIYLAAKLVANFQIGCHFIEYENLWRLTKWSCDSAVSVWLVVQQNDHRPIDICHG